MMKMNWSQAINETERVLRPVERPAGTWKNEPNADFYQTIIDNNLFAPLGTVLNQKPSPGANLKLIATFTHDATADATAIFQNIATGAKKTVGVEDVIQGCRVRDIKPKQVLIGKDGEPAIWKRIKPTFLD